MLAFNVAQLLKEGTGASRQYTVSGELLDVDAGNAGPVVVTGEVRLVRAVRGIVAQGYAELCLARICRRCGDATSSAVRLDIEEEYIPSLDVETGASLPISDDDDRDLVIDEHHVLDLAPVLRQLAVAAVLLPSLCRDDCRGLCPTCGANLNVETCSCARRAVDPRLSALASLLAADATITETTTD